jgi:hypothetical protein
MSPRVWIFEVTYAARGSRKIISPLEKNLESKNNLVRFFAGGSAGENKDGREGSVPDRLD